MKKIAIYGATSAIAVATARRYAGHAAEFFLVARDARKLQALNDDLVLRGAKRVDCAISDLADWEQHTSLIDRAEQSLHDSDVSLIAYGTLGAHEECAHSFAAARRELNTNLLSPISLLTLLADRYEARRRGCLAVITSVAGDRGRQSNYVYGTAKGGLAIFLQGLRNRLFASGVGVLTIKPGLVDTPMTAHLRKGPLFASPEVIAAGIERAIEHRRDVVYLPGFWRPIMLVVKAMPETLFKRLRL